MTKETQEPTFWAAPELASAGYPVFPLNGKAPAVAGGFYAATTDHSEIAHWIAEDDMGDHDIGVVTGHASGLVVIEADTQARRAQMEERFGPPTVITRKGAHWYFRHPRDGKVISRKVVAGLDCKADGGYVAVPPSSGKSWASESGIPDKKSLPPLPRGLREELRSGSQVTETNGHVAVDEFAGVEAAAVIARHVKELKSGERHEHLRHVCGALLKRGVAQKSAEAMLIKAWQLVDGELAERALKEVPNTLNTTAAALANGGATGVPSMEKLTPGLFNELEAILSRDDPILAEGKPDEGASHAKAPTDDELRDRFIERHPDYCYGLGDWRRYGDGVWTPTAELKVKRLVVAVLEEAKPEKVRPNKSLMNSVAELTKVRVAVEDEVWDADPNILVCANGALDLQARKLLPHSKEHFATARVPYDYDENARSEVWEERVMGEIIANHLDLAAVGFFQEFAGYCLTTDTSHEIALWLTGKHGGGRSTILAGLDAMLGPRAGVLSLSDIERSNFALTNLPGKTLVTATEQPGTFMRGGGILNAIISGEPIQVDVKFKDPMTIIPRCKIAWAMNEVPRVGNPDDGLYRRVKILSIPEIPEKQRDPQVKEGVKAAGAAILNWALDGLERLRARGYFEVPEKVSDATEEFKQDNDVTGLFVDEMCIKSPEFWEGSSNLYTRYSEWAKDHGHIPMSTITIAKEWRRLGFEQRRGGKGVRWHGVKLRNASDYFSDL
jgi:P4 family phage/plasmid primase-like protien